MSENIMKVAYAVQSQKLTQKVIKRILLKKVLKKVLTDFYLLKKVLKPK